MNKKTLAILFGVFVILLGALYISNNSGREAQTGTTNDAPYFSEDIASATELTISDAEGERKLVKTGEEWVINGFTADQTTVKSFLDEISAVKRTELVARNSDNHQKMGVDDNGTRVTVGNRTLIVGNAGPQGNTFYARSPEDDDVYLFTGGIQSRVSQDESGWRDKTIVTVSADQLERVEIEQTDGTLTLAKTDKEWSVTKDGATKPLPQETADALTKVVDPLNASGFADDELAAGFDDLADKTTVLLYKTGSEEPITITVADKDGLKLAKAEGMVYTLAIYTYNQLVPDVADVSEAEDVTRAGDEATSE